MYQHMLAVVCAGALVAAAAAGQQAASSSTQALTFPVEQAKVAKAGAMGEEAGNVAHAATRLSIKTGGLECASCKEIGVEAECCGKETVAVLDESGLAMTPQLNTTARNVQLTLEPGRVLLLSQLDAALQEAGYQTARGTMPVAVFTRLSIRGVADEEAAEALETNAALIRVLAIESVAYDPESDTAFLVIGSVKQPGTVAALAKTIEAIPSLELVDVAYIGACEDCSDAGHKQASCGSCWQAMENRYFF